MRNIVFLFSKKGKDRFDKITVHMTEKKGTSRYAFENMFYYPFHKHFDRFEMSDGDLMRRLHPCWPSVLLRVFMHAEIIAAHRPEGYTVSCTNIPCVRQSIVILSKNFHRGKSFHSLEPILRELKRNGNILLIDNVEDSLQAEAIPYYDGIICCSHSAYQYYTKECSKTRNTPVYFVEHCVDQRIQKISFPHKYDGLATYYFGAPENILLFDAVEPLVNVVYTDIDGVPGQSWLSRLHEANFHYALRPPQSEAIYKPFTKGFIAAACNANILVHKDDGDALYYLGEEYPYLIKETLTEDVVLRFMHKAQAEFGTEIWDFGLSKMARLRSKFSGETIAAQFWHMIDKVIGKRALVQKQGSGLPLTAVSIF